MPNQSRAICWLITVLTLTSLGLARQAATAQARRQSSFELGNKGATPRFVRSDLKGVKHALDCGGPCQYAEGGGIRHAATGIPVLQRSFSCPTTWMRMLSSCSSPDGPPPPQIPLDMLPAYTMNATVETKTWYFDEKYRPNVTSKAVLNDWDTLDLDKRIQATTLTEATATIFNYSPGVCEYVDSVIRRHSDAIRGGSGIVLGTRRPWAEVILARHGALLTVTVEYGAIHSSHDTIVATTPKQLAAFMLQSPRAFDFVFTFSSLEHSGLGRYGDELNPYGDLEAVAQSWCALKPGGLLFLGLPSVDPQGSKDELVWNAHRMYGPRRLAQMFAGFEHVRSYNEGADPSAAIIHVLRKPLL